MIFHDISRECYDWLKKQPNVKEESLTDWILYTVSERSSQFYYKAFSRNEEAYNGADWEWWILTGDYSNYTAYRFLVQAKKLKKDQDNYPLISYSNRNGLQIDLLIDSAKCRNAMPIYIYYSTSSPELNKQIENFSFIEEDIVAAPVGTTITVEKLFFNTPVRYKFLKKDYTEAGYIEDIISKIALVNPKVAFKFINNKKTIIQTTGDGNILNCIYNIFGKDIAKSIVPFREELDGIVVEGALGKEDISRSNRSNEIFFVNERYIKNKTLTSAVENAYQTIIPIGKFPYCIINVKMPATLVDVNVHPTKTEVRFADEGLIYRAVYHVVKEKMLKQDLVPEVKEKEEELKPTF